MARVTFLGTGAALPTTDRTNTTLAIQQDDGAPALLIDAGGDVYRALLRSGLALDAIPDLFLTHAHIDHLGSLPSLLESFRLGGRTAPLRILALPEVLEVTQRLLAAFDFELTLDAWTFAVRFEAVEHGQQVFLAGIPATFYRVDHAVPCAGVRLETTGGTIAYTSDTQPTPSLHLLGHGARLFITECTHLAGSEQSARGAKHMTAREAGEQAQRCGAERLALVHLGVAAGWPAEVAVAQAAEVFAGAVLAPHDGEVLTL